MQTTVGGPRSGIIFLFISYSFRFRFVLCSYYLRSIFALIAIVFSITCSNSFHIMFLLFSNYVHTISTLVSYYVLIIFSVLRGPVDGALGE